MAKVELRDDSSRTARCWSALCPPPRPDRADKRLARVGARRRVSLGCDRVRFLAPVFFGDTITVTIYGHRRSTRQKAPSGEMTITNQDGMLVAVATHMLRSG